MLENPVTTHSLLGKLAFQYVPFSFSEGGPVGSGGARERKVEGRDPCVDQKSVIMSGNGQSKDPNLRELTF